MEVAQLLCGFILMILAVIVGLFAWHEYVKKLVGSEGFLGKFTATPCMYGYYKNPNNLCNYA